MSCNQREFYVIKNKYLANALNYLGHRYYKFKDDEGNTVYSFVNTTDFGMKLSALKQLKGLNLD